MKNLQKRIKVISSPKKPKTFVSKRFLEFWNIFFERKKNKNAIAGVGLLSAGVRSDMRH
jgi:hypothetical protein